MMQHLVGVLYEHFVHISKADPVNMAALDVLTKHLFQLSQSMPDPSARAARDHLTAMQDGLQTRMSTGQRMPVLSYWFFCCICLLLINFDWRRLRQVRGRKGAWPWPGAEDLLFLKLVSVIFPTTGTPFRLSSQDLTLNVLKRQTSSTRWSRQHCCS